MPARSHAEIVRLLGGPRAVAEAIGIGKFAVRSWVGRDSIPGRFWPRLARLLEETGSGLTIADLAAAAPARRSHARKPDAKCVTMQANSAGSSSAALRAA